MSDLIPQKDVVALNEVVVTGNKPSASFGMNALNFGLNIGGATTSTSAGLRYTERPWGVVILEQKVARHIQCLY